jgi:hypothetical protein
MGCRLQGPEARGSIEEIVREVLLCDREHGPALRKRHMGGRMEELLTSFHDRCLRHIRSVASLLD